MLWHKSCPVFIEIRAGDDRESGTSIIDWPTDGEPAVLRGNTTNAKAAEDEAVTGELTRDRFTELLRETYQRLGVTLPEKVSVKGWLEDWLASCKGATKDSTYLAYEQAVRDFVHFLGQPVSNRSITGITLETINAFRDKLLGEGLSPSTVNKLIKKYLNTPFELARKTGKISFNPINGFKTLKSAPATKGRFSPEQVSRLLTACGKDEDWRGAILCAYSTGMRLQDIANLQWPNIDLVHGVIQFTQRKSTTGAKAVIGVHPDFEEWLMAPGRAGDNDGPVFPSLANRDGGGRNGLSKAFERIMIRAGIVSAVIKERLPKGKSRSVRALSFHSFRHTAASEVFNQQALKEVARRVTAHAPDGSVDVYIHHDLEAIKAATALIPRVPKNGEKR
jgi:integrase